MAPEIFPCIQSEISEKDSNWSMTTDSVKVGNAVEILTAEEAPHCVFFQLYNSDHAFSLFLSSLPP